MNVKKWMLSLAVFTFSGSVFADEPALHPVTVDGSHYPGPANDGIMEFRISGDDIYIMHGKNISEESKDRTYTFIKYNSKTNIAKKSPSFVASKYFPGPDIEPVSIGSNQVFFTYSGAVNDTFESSGLHLYDFSTESFIKVNSAPGRVYSVSENGNYVLYSDNGQNHIRNIETSEIVSLVEEDSYRVNSITSIADNGDLFKRYRRDSKYAYTVFDLSERQWFDLETYTPDDVDISFSGLIHSISPNGKYIAGFSEIDGAFNAVLVDREQKKVYKKVIEGTAIGGIITEHNISNSGIASFVSVTQVNDKITQSAITYDFINGKTIIESIADESISLDEGPRKAVFATSGNADVAVVAVKEPGSTAGFLYWTNLNATGTGTNNILKVTPESLTVDPYLNQTVTVDINTEGVLFAADVSCNVNGPANISQANYGDWGDANRLSLPMTVNDKEWKGALSQKAPSQAVSAPSTFSEWTLLADVTTADVNISCTVLASDNEGQLIDMAVENATIRLDDKIHGGDAVINGQINIPNADDLSGVKVIVTLNGRTVTLTTDENGNFSFDGLRDGEFTVSFESPNHVQACQVAVIEGGESVNVGQIELLVGDITDDGVIDILDFTYLAARYNSQAGDSDYDIKADLNRDGIINIQDLAILGSHFGSSQCDTTVGE